MMVLELALTPLAADQAQMMDEAGERSKRLDCLET